MYKTKSGGVDLERGRPLYTRVRMLENAVGVPNSAKKRNETGWLQTGNQTSYVFLESADRIAQVACLALEKGDGTRRPKVP
jgi:hypothetical protein